MKWLRHRKARVDREAGLVFAWRGMNPGFRRKISAVLVVGLAGVMLAAAVRVRVVPPAPVSQRKASVMIAGPGGAAEFLLGRFNEVSPFPARFETRGLAEIERRLATTMIAADAEGVGYRPRLRDLPPDGPADDLAGLLARGVELPGLPVAGGQPSRLEPPTRLGAELAPDSADLASRVVTPVPELELAGDAVAAGHAARFLVEVRADGSVGEVVPLGGAGATVVPGVEAWLASLRFDVSGGAGGWHAVEVKWVPRDD